MQKIFKPDVFIAGAGPAGIAAAVAAADCGLKVSIAERNSFPGGRATASAVGTICGLYLRSGANPQFAMKGFPMAFAERQMEFSGRKPVIFSDGLWFLPSHPLDFENTARSFLSDDKITVHYETATTKSEMSNGEISAVHCKHNGEEIKFLPACTVDCSGDGALSSSVNHPVISDKEYQAAAIVFSMKNISVAEEFQMNFLLLKCITSQVNNGRVPEYYNLLGIIPHSLNGGSVQFKMGLPWKVGKEELRTAGERAGTLVMEMVEFIRTSVPGFEKAEIDWIAREVGIRTGIRALGRKILTIDEVVNCKKTIDSVCNGAWPVEYWRTGNKRVEMTFFQEEDYYSVPAGCLESGEVSNLFFAGKIISADEKAIASARVIGTCLGTGYAAGLLAAYKVLGKKREDAISYIRDKMLLVK